MLEVFPVDASGRPRFSHDWGAPRSGGRTHEGTDIFAPEGTPVLAVVGGTVRSGVSTLGGTFAHLTGDDGRRYYFAHLAAFTGESPRKVRAGEQIGEVGNTGNAIGLPHHLHFEIREGDIALDPYPELMALAPGRPAPALPPSLSTVGSSAVSPLLGLGVTAGLVYALERWFK
jgi:murein DD-endopeptidase MepM/ murein hydrolase activator NlpD